MSNIIPMVSTSHPSVDDAWEDDDDFGIFASAPVFETNNNQCGSGNSDFYVDWSKVTSASVCSVQTEDNDLSEKCVVSGLEVQGMKGSEDNGRNCSLSGPIKDDYDAAHVEDDNTAEFTASESNSENCPVKQSVPQVGLAFQGIGHQLVDHVNRKSQCKGTTTPERTLEISQESAVTDSGVYSSDLSPVALNESWSNSEEERVINSEDETSAELPQDSHLGEEKILSEPGNNCSNELINVDKSSAKQIEVFDKSDTVFCDSHLQTSPKRGETVQKFDKATPHSDMEKQADETGEHVSVQKCYIYEADICRTTDSPYNSDLSKQKLSKLGIPLNEFADEGIQETNEWVASDSSNLIPSAIGINQQCKSLKENDDFLESDDDFGDFSCPPLAVVDPAVSSNSSDKNAFSSPLESADTGYEFGAFSHNFADSGHGDSDFGNFCRQTVAVAGSADWASFGTSPKEQTGDTDLSEFSETKPETEQGTRESLASADIDRWKKCCGKTLSDCFWGSASPTCGVSKKLTDNDTETVHSDHTAKAGSEGKFGVLETSWLQGTHLSSLSGSQQTAQHLSKKTPHMELWNQLQNVDGSSALGYQWAKSTIYSHLLHTLRIDVQNMLIGHKKPSVPVFATGLSLLEPTRGGRQRGCAVSDKTGVTHSMNVKLGNPAEQNRQQLSQEIPAVEFDWRASGLINPLTSNSLDLDFIGVQDSNISEKLIAGGP